MTSGDVHGSLALARMGGPTPTHPVNILRSRLAKLLHTHSGRVARWAPANISLCPSPPGSGSPGRAAPRAHWWRKAAAPKGPAPSQRHTVSLDKTYINGKSTASENNKEERRLHRVQVLLGEMRWLSKRRWAWESQKRKPHLPTPAHSLPHRACCWGCPAHPQGCQVTASGTRGSLTLRALLASLVNSRWPDPSPKPRNKSI